MFVAKAMPAIRRSALPHPLAGEGTREPRAWRLSLRSYESI
jgi:hypothetical protein